MARLPIPGSDNGTWGDILNEYLSQSHESDGTLKSDSVGSTQIQNGAILEAQLDSGVQTKLNTVAPAISVALKNTAVAIGDSITAFGTSPYGYTASDNWFSQLGVQSYQRIQPVGVFATNGYNISQIRSAHVPSVLAMDPLPGACFIFAGTNDVGITSLTTMQTHLQDMVSDLVEEGVMPILMTVPGRDSVTGSEVEAWNNWLVRYGALNGISVVDTHSPLLDATTGNMVDPLYSTDGIHPTVTGHRIIAEVALAAGIANRFPVNGPLTSKSVKDMTNTFNDGSVTYGLAVTDTNVDGLADGWNGGSGGTRTHTIVTPTAEDNLAGNWQEMSRTDTDSGGWAMAFTPKIYSASSAFTVGDRMAFSARIQTEDVESTETSWYFRIVTNSTDPNEIVKGPSDVECDFDGLIYAEFDAPVGATEMQMSLGISTIPSSGTVKVRVGEVTLRNLTVDGADA